MESERPTIGDLIDTGVITVHKDGNHGSNYPRGHEFGDEGVLFLTAKLLSDSGRIDFESAPRLNSEKAKKIKFGYLKTDDVLLSHNATVGRVAVVPTISEEVLIGTSLTHFRLDTDQLLPRYLAAFFSGRDFQNQLAAFMSLSTRNQVPITAQRKLRVDVPRMDVQRSIAHILKTLDDKIELNRRMNETLESMARALFKSWFVDFDPVIDNALAAGNSIPEPLAARAESRRDLGPARKPLADNIRSLFPATFAFDEEMGWVPEGWEVKPLGTYLQVLETGRRPKGGVSKYTTGVPSVGAESINGIGNFEFGKTKFVPHDFFDEMKSGKVQCHDVLLYKDGGKPGDFKPRIGMFGKGFPFDEFGINEHVFRLRSNELGQPFLYFQTASERVFHHLRVRGGKAAIPGVNRTEVKSVEFLVPSNDLLEQFNRSTFAMIDRVLDNASTSRCLAKLRDTLLPKLLSGELRIPEAEKLVANSV